MKAAVMRDWALTIEELPDPRPKSGQALTKVLACGICGSDLHLLQHGERQMALGAEMRASQPPDPMAPHPLDPHGSTVMGHEFCCEVVELGPDTSQLAVGDRVVCVPGVFDETGVHSIGFSSVYPGGYAELMVLNDLLALKVPNGLPSHLAALTEPLAVGIHAVNKSGIARSDAAVVIGCGPVGLAVIADLTMKGVGTIVAADLSPRRRQLAAQLGAHEVVDPSAEPVIEAWRRVDGARPLVIFEAVGVPGMLDAAMLMAPKGSRIVVVGVCMEEDRVRPLIGIGKELNLQFVLGYTPEEFAHSLHALAEGATDLAALVTGTVGIDDVPRSFSDLANPEAHAKILVCP
jgi:threonine dehydrogenase-like Zn-dependent dehydrogenase